MNKPNYTDCIKRILTTVGIFSYLLNMFFLFMYDDYEMMPLVTLILSQILLLHHAFYYAALYRFTLRKHKAGYEQPISYKTYRWACWILILLNAFTFLAIMELIDAIF